MVYCFQKKGKGFGFRMCKQVRYKALDNWNSNEILGGIGIYNDDGSLVNVICGCCGAMFEPDEVVVVEEFDHWIDINEEIIGDNHW